MAVTCNLTYKGIPITGARVTVKTASQFQTAEDSVSGTAASSGATYAVEVRSPNGSILDLPEWRSVTIAADFSAAPLALAESAMRPGLAAEGASNIEDV